MVIIRQEVIRIEPIVVVEYPDSRWGCSLFLKQTTVDQINGKPFHFRNSIGLKLGVELQKHPAVGCIFLSLAVKVAECSPHCHRSRKVPS